jgi:hypothetical protein
MGVSDVLAHEYFRLPARLALADQLGFAEKGRDGFLDFGAGFRAGDDEGIIPDGQGTPRDIIRGNKQRLRGGYQPDFAVGSELGEDAQAVTVDARPLLNL